MLQTMSVFLALCLLSGQLQADDSNHDLLLFISVDSLNDFDVNPPMSVESFVRPAVDVLYSYSGDRFRFLGEYLWSSHESELERFKFGWQPGDNTMLWFGRFHSTAKFWTSEYHHGQFMQTSITRPSVEEWEDESGPMPSHLTGLAIEHELFLTNESALEFGFSLGLAPKFVDDELYAYDMLDPDSDHDLATNIRLAYRPDIFSDDQFGILVGWNDINVDSDSSPALTDLNEIKQLTVVVFADWRWQDWRILANAVYFDNELNYVDTSTDDDFVAAYLQIDYQVSEAWTVFGRTDNGFGEDKSPYLRLLPEFLAHRHMLGARWDFQTFQSLTLELADTSAQGENFDHSNFKEVRLQWSAVFP